MVRGCLKSGMTKEPILNIVKAIQYGVPDEDEREEEEEEPEDDMMHDQMSPAQHNPAAAQAPITDQASEEAKKNVRPTW